MRLAEGHRRETFPRRVEQTFGVQTVSTNRFLWSQTLRSKTMDFCVSIIWSAPAMRFCAAQRRATRRRCDKETAAFQLIRVTFPGVTLAIAVD